MSIARFETDVLANANVAALLGCLRSSVPWGLA